MIVLQNRAERRVRIHLKSIPGFQVVFLWALMACPLLVACDSGNPDRAEGGAASPGSGAGGQTSDFIFEDRSRDAGIDFVHQNGATGELLLSEVVGSGVALVDVDQDGDLDVYLVQDTEVEGAASPSTPIGDRLFRNDLLRLEDGKLVEGPLRFVDVTEAAGITARGAGMGVAVGDIDNDGCYDLYVLNRGPNQLWRNRCDGTFEDVTARAGVGDERWGVSASFLDIDSDGYLDIYVANYVNIPEGENRACSSPSGIPEYCSPQVFSPEVDTLLRNRGDGTFEDVSVSSGIRGAAQNGLGVVTRDFNRDGFPDLYVANDMTPNFLWVNRGDGTFEDQALLSGSAVNRSGRSEASMGLALADVDWDGDDDIFVTHLSRESHTMYRNRGNLSFEDDTPSFGLESLTNESTGFGTHFFDYDNDGWLDIIVCSGAVTSTRKRVSTTEEVTLRQPNQLFRNSGNGTFVDVSPQAGPGITDLEVSRGLAVGDIDNDGDADVILTNNGGPARLLINRVGTENRWLGIRVVDRRLRRDSLGARVRLIFADGSSKVQTVRVDGSYASSSDPRVLFGLGSSTEIPEVEVIWPDGWTMQTQPEVLDSYWVVERTGKEAPTAAGEE